MVKKAAKLAADLDIQVDVTQNLENYSIAIQQMIAIARAVDMDCKVLILDEPTSSLDDNEVEKLFVLMRRLRDQGVGIVFVTHFLEPVSYTHLDVYKRQAWPSTKAVNRRTMAQASSAASAAKRSKLAGAWPEASSEMVRSTTKGMWFR